MDAWGNEWMNSAWRFKLCSLNKRILHWLDHPMVLLSHWQRLLTTTYILSLPLKVTLPSLRTKFQVTSAVKLKSEQVCEPHLDAFSCSYIWTFPLESVPTECQLSEGRKHNLCLAFVFSFLFLQSLSIFALLFSFIISFTTPQLSLQM